MRRYGIDIICLQETWASQAEYYNNEGYKVILSGSDAIGRSWAGVGFVVSPRYVNRIHGFLQFSDRLASLKLNVAGGKVGIITGYAPHNLKPYDDRHRFYLELGTLLELTSVNGPKYILGDFNARIGFQRPGEDTCYGPFGFGRELVHITDIPNRDLLLEFCTEMEYAVGNMFISTPAEQKITYMEPGSNPFSPICPQNFAMLDLILVPQRCLEDLVTVVSIREASLPTDHLLTYCLLQVVFDRAPEGHRHHTKDRSALQQPAVRQSFANRFVGECQRSEESSFTTEEHWQKISQSLASAEEHVPEKTAKAKKPWIRPLTLHLVQQRQDAREHGNIALEKSLNKSVHKSARADRAAWLDNLVKDGTWEGVRKLRRPRKANQGRLRDEAGNLVSSESRAETMAAYLERVQWCVRPATVTAEPLMGEVLPVKLEQFDPEEVRSVIQKLRSEKACGPDGVPAEYLKALLGSQSALQEMTSFLSGCWQRCEVPSDWHLATVTAIHKKGRVDLCENYRPISLLSIWYKVFAALIHRRLVDAGAEGKISKSQFGFCSGRSTLDAIFTLRRRVDVAWAQQNGRLLVLALDWQKAFDAIDPSAMIGALTRFGLPQHVLEVIRAIYSDRKFEVRDCGQTSHSRYQMSGISQGCPLSPFLFVMLMTVLMHDAVNELPAKEKELMQRGGLAELLYADDTLLLSVSADSLQVFLASVSKAGAEYGLKLHFGKFQFLQVRADTVVRSPDLSPIVPEPDILYLGSLVSDDGRITRELSRRLGMANGDFRALARVWRHSTLGRQRRLELFKALVVSKLLYGLPAAWLNTSERRRLNGFHNRCLRVIWGIKPSFVSRVSNASVLATTGQPLLSDTLLKRQLLLFGRVARLSDDSVMRAATFCPGSLRPATDRYKRKLGRPRMEWTTEVGKIALRVAGTHSNLQHTIKDAGVWRNMVESSV